MLASLCAVLAAPLIGSFVSVLSARYPDWRTIAWGRSRCPQCLHPLSVSELVPIASWIIQRGRCRHCARAIAAAYPWIELAALAVAIWAAAAMPAPLLPITCALGWVLLAAAAVDHRHFLLPDALTLPLAAAGLALTWFDRPQDLADHAIGAASGYLTFALISGLYRRVRHRAGLGMGDAKLFAAAGAWVSWSGLPSVALIATLTALSATLLLAALKRAPVDATHRLPFGPYLAFGFWVVWVHGPIMAAL